MTFRSIPCLVFLLAAATALAGLWLPAPARGDTIADSLCVGLDCPTNPNFVDTTILLMENNTRIKFDDTSSTSSFPNQDWGLIANEQSNGGANRFMIMDCGLSSQGGCTGNKVLSLESGAPDNALYVTSSGRIGLRTSTPVEDLEILAGDSPGVRLHQSTGGGFAAQSWDVVGNETNFFVRDVTNGGRLPFRIFPDAPADGLVLQSTGRVGIGTSSPAADLHISGGDSEDIFAGFGVSPPSNCSANFGYGGASFGPGVSFVNSFACSGASNNEKLLLMVAGTAVITLDRTSASVDGELKVNNMTMNVPDFVFAPDYELESIERHAARMWADRHLPAIEPARALRRSLDVAKLSMGMLEELEKAHIYIEQLHGRLKDKETQIETLRRESRQVQQRLERLEAALVVAAQE